MACDLLQDVVVSLFRRTAFYYIVELISIDASVVLPSSWACAKLLLVFPDNDLGRHLPVVRVDPGNRERGAGLPAVKGGKLDPSLRGGRNAFEVVAVLAACRGIGVIRSAIVNAAFDTVNGMGHAG